MSLSPTSPTPDWIKNSTTFGELKDYLKKDMDLIEEVDEEKLASPQINQKVAIAKKESLESSSNGTDPQSDGRPNLQ